MKILFINYWLHSKNEYALMNYKKIQFTIIKEIREIDNFNLSEFDCVYSPGLPIDVSKYPTTKFIFGPHFHVFPDDRLIPIKGNNSVYIQPSEWVLKFWSDNIKYKVVNGLNIQKLPFGVDTVKFDKYKDLSERNKIFIYFKNRDPIDLTFIKNFMNSKNIEYKIFSYNDRYSEEDYINYLRESLYGIWVGGHESQGFALQEALSCDVPLLVWNIKSMNQEYGSNYEDIPAKTNSYWHERCGEEFFNSLELEPIYYKFINNLENYKPREFILENLSLEICENKLIDIIKKINI